MIINGTGGDDFLSGSVGEDTFNLFGGNDSAFGFDGRDTMFGGGGQDYLAGGNGADSLVGGSGADTLFGSEGLDNLSGGADEDVLYGGLGADTLNSGSGNFDSIFGGDGADVLTFGSGVGYLANLGGADGDRDVVNATTTLLVEVENMTEGVGATADRINWSSSGSAIDAAGNNDGLISAADDGGSFSVFVTSTHLTIIRNSDGTELDLTGVGSSTFEQMII